MLRATIPNQTQQQGLSALRKPTAAGGTKGQLALGHGENGFHQRAATLFLARKGGLHLRSDTMNPPRSQLSRPFDTM